MLNKNEMIMVNKILNTELSVRQMAKQFGLRRDDFVRRIREMIADQPEMLEQLDLVLVLNQMLYANMSVKQASKKLNITEEELDKRIRRTLVDNPVKMKRYEEYLDPVTNKQVVQRSLSNFKYKLRIAEDPEFAASEKKKRMERRKQRMKEQQAEAKKKKEAKKKDTKKETKDNVGNDVHIVPEDKKTKDTKKKATTKKENKDGK